MNEFQGNYQQAEGPVAIIRSRYNPTIVDRLMGGARQALSEAALDDASVDVFSVPGAFEIPQLARKLAQSGRYSAIVTLGCVVRGETPHFDYVAGECARAIAQLSLDHDAAMVFGVLTTDTFAQAMERAAESESNKGYEAMVTALEMADLNRILESQ